MRSRYLPRFVPLVLVVLLLAACSGSSGEAADTTVPPTTTVAPTTTTVAPTKTAAATTTTTTTILPDPWRYVEGDHKYAYQSLGYSCEPDPATGCDGDNDMSLVQIWLHKDDKDEGGESRAADCLDIIMKPQPGSYDFMDLLGNVDDPIFTGSGWGVRVVQLDSPPAGLGMGGNAWLELTVSSVSAASFAALPPQVPVTEGFHRYPAPTEGDPVSIEAIADTTNFVEELVLVETTDDMMQWIIVLNDDETFHHYAGYWGGSAGGGTNGLAIKIGPGKS
jgi:hypothetical protein